MTVALIIIAVASLMSNVAIALILSASNRRLADMAFIEARERSSYLSFAEKKLGNQAEEINSTASETESMAEDDMLDMSGLRRTSPLKGIMKT